MQVSAREVPDLPGAGCKTTRRTRLPCVLSLSGLLALTGCTTVGMHTQARKKVDFGPPATVRVCLLKTSDISERRAETLQGVVQREFAQYGLHIEVPWVREWQRPGFEVGSILNDLLQRPLEPPCDRLFGLVDRHLGDFAWGLVMPEVLGAVDGPSATRGYVVATFGSVNQLFMFPEQAIVHEFYHLFGCPHGFTLSKCYQSIAAVKAAVQPDADFFPGVRLWRPDEEEGAKAEDDQDVILRTRAEVDAAIAGYLEYLEKSKATAAAKKAKGPRERTGTASR
jgi:hypothetical protein